MTRQQIENEILQHMSLLDSDGTTTHADAGTELFIQARIQEAFDRIWMESRCSFTRKVFSVYFRDPVTTGTINVTKGSASGTLSTDNTPDVNWIGGHVWIADNLAPLRVIEFNAATRVLTFAEIYQGTTNATSSFTFYYDGALLPTDCRAIIEGSVKLHGRRHTRIISRRDLDARQGYFGWNGTDYGRWYNGSGVIQQPDVGSPTVYGLFESYKDASSYVRPIINVYPYPDEGCALTFDGWMKPAALSGDSDTSLLPEQFHRLTWLPLTKLLMCEYPGWEMSAQERDTVATMYRAGLSKMMDEQHLDAGELQDFIPASCLR